MTTKELYDKCEQYVLSLIDEAEYPEGHPFNDFPHTPESMPLKMIAIILALTNNEKMIENYVAKCKSIENGKYSPVKYNQSVSELTWLYYLLNSIPQTRLCDLMEVYGEERELIDNNKKFEYSFLLRNPECITAFEVKAITCDPFIKEDALPPTDGAKLIKPLFPQLKNSTFLKEQKDYTVLNSSTYYYQLEQNIKRIANKCRGNNISGKKLYCFGAIFINASTSFEEFYSYLFHKEYGLYHYIAESSIDVLSIVSLDDKNDSRLSNIYNNGYVQTIVPNPEDDLIRICKALRLDNYIAVGDNINPIVLEKSNDEYGYYKVLCREGYLGIIPEETSEQEIQDYVSYLKGTEIR